MRKSGLINHIITSRNSSLSGRELFSKMMTHFGSEARGIYGVFVEDNLLTINQLTAQGMPLERAINFNFTARMAAEYGFMRVRLLTASGTPGNYRGVTAVYY
jgi:hypothetical protein